MRVVAIGILRKFWTKHAAAEVPLRAWYAEVSRAAWHTPRDIKARFASASFVANNRVVFNIKGNNYRLILAVAYRMQVAYIKFVGTHAEYNRIDASTIEKE